MNIKLVYSALIALILASCSSDDLPVPTPKPAPETVGVYMSLGVKDGSLRTRAASVVSDPQGTMDVKTLTVAVFRGKVTAVESEGGSSQTESEGTLMYMHTFNSFVEETSGDAYKLYKASAVKSADGNFQINGIKVKAGNLHLLVMANMPDDLVQKCSGKNLTEVKKLAYANLGNEGFNVLSSNIKATSFPCSMTSSVTSISVTPDNENDVFYVLGNTPEKATPSGTITGDKEQVFDRAKGTASIELVRNVSAICLRNLIFKPSQGNISGTQAKLTVKKIVVANVLKDCPLFAPAGEFASFGFTNYFVCGEEIYAKQTNLALKSQENTYQPFLEKEIGKTLIASSSALGQLEQDFNSPECIGRPFMVYENSAAMNLGGGNQTLLIIQADYYMDATNTKPTYVDRYYAVVVNDKEDASGGGYNTNGKLIERNFIYFIDMTIIGPGSNTPYEPLYSANMVAKVVAAPWEQAFSYTPEGPGLE